MKDYIGLVLVAVGMVMLFSTFFYWLFMLSTTIGLIAVSVFIIIVGFAIGEVDW